MGQEKAGWDRVRWNRGTGVKWGSEVAWGGGGIRLDEEGRGRVE